MPSFPRLCDRLLHGKRRIDVLFVAFDVLHHQGEPTLRLPYRARRERLEAFGGGVGWRVADAYGDGEALWRRVCEHGLEGVVAKRLSGSYQPGRRGWVKVKNQAYWRYPLELEAVRRGRERDRLGPRSRCHLQLLAAATSRLIAAAGARSCHGATRRSVLGRRQARGMGHVSSGAGTKQSGSPCRVYLVTGHFQAWLGAHRLCHHVVQWHVIAGSGGVADREGERVERSSAVSMP